MKRILTAALLLAPAASGPAQFPVAWRATADSFHATLTREGVVGGALWLVKGDSELARQVTSP